MPLFGSPTMFVLTTSELVKIPVFVPVSMRIRFSKSPELFVTRTLTVSIVVEFVLRFKSLTRTLTGVLAG